jgi:GntR family transcriptional regulator, transcriptional repressor for pyruvate dehydrogenase complex
MESELTFLPIERATVSAQIRSQLLRRMTTGELAPGTRMPSERELAEQFAVARTSVREAIQGLVSLGAIERRGNRSYVAERLPEVEVGAEADRRGFVRELFETRRVLELPIFELAAINADDEVRAQVLRLADSFDPAMKIEDFRRLDREFHTTIASGCGNTLLIELYGKVLDRLFRSASFDELLASRSRRQEVRRIIAESVAAHHQLAAAMADRDPVAMALACGDHLATVESRLTQLA